MPRFSGGCQETPNGEFPGVPNKRRLCHEMVWISMVSGSHLEAMFAYESVDKTHLNVKAGIVSHLWQCHLNLDKGWISIRCLDKYPLSG